MRALHGLLLVGVAGCPNRQDVQCLDNTSCDRFASGTCRLNVTGNRWCSYPDPSCPEGYRYSDLDVGDGVSGQCVRSSSNVDAGIDGPANGSCVPELMFQRGTLFQSPEILRVDLESFNEMPVSNGIDIDTDAEWSPDGNRVVLTRNGSSIWVVNRDRSAPKQIDSQPGFFLFSPVWSPDGTRVVYSSEPTAGGVSTIYSAAVAGSTPIPLTLGGQDGRGPIQWSPDGATILFLSNRTGNLDVFSMAANGANAINLTNRSGSDSDARWSPDGGSIVFVGQGQIWTMNGDGTNPQNRTGTAGGSYGSPSWSSNGQVYYVKDPLGAGALYVMNANGTNQHSIDSSNAIDLEPVPSPDGSKIAWSSTRDGNREIYVSNPDGSNPVRVTNNSRADLRPRWRPCP